METMTTPRPLVVVESGHVAGREAMVRSLQAVGFDVLTCPGPRQLHAGGCPLLETSDCPQAGRATAVVHDLDLDDPVEREVLLTLRARYPRLPVVVEVPTAPARRHHALLAGCTVVAPYSPDRLAEVVRDVVRTA